MDFTLDHVVKRMKEQERARNQQIRPFLNVTDYTSVLTYQERYRLNFPYLANTGGWKPDPISPLPIASQWQNHVMPSPHQPLYPFRIGPLG